MGLNMEDEIDLRAYIGILLKNKYWIAGLTVLAAAVAFGVSALLPATYRSTALVTVTKPSYDVRFDSRLVARIDDQPSDKVYPALAKSDQVASAVIDTLGSQLGPGVWSVGTVRDMLTARSGDDPSMINLMVEDSDPERATLVVNTWAALFVKMVNELYGQEADLATFEAQLAQADLSLSQAEQDLIDFQSQNEAAVLGAQLEDRRAALSGYLSIAQSLRLIIQDIESQQERLRSQNLAEDVSLSGQLTALLLEIDGLSSYRQRVSSTSKGRNAQAFSHDGDSVDVSIQLQIATEQSGATPIQFQISDSQTLGDRSVEEQIAFLDSLVPVVESKLAAVEREAESLEPDILRLQEGVARVEVEEARLRMTQDMAREVYITLSRKVSEIKFIDQELIDTARLVSIAVGPGKAVQQRIALNVAVVGALGLLIGVFGAFAVEYWRQGQAEQEAQA